jgi:hypothetical protein
MFYKFIWNLSESLGIGLGIFAPFVFGEMIERKVLKQCNETRK